MDTVYWADSGGWSRWSPWSECSTSCGPGTKIRRRVCFPQVQCSGPNDELLPCEITSCDEEPEKDSMSKSKETPKIVIWLSGPNIFMTDDYNGF